MEETSSSPDSFDLDAYHSRVRELEARHKNLEEASEKSPSDVDKLLMDCVLHFENRVQKIVSELPEAVKLLGIEDLDIYVERLKEELKQVEAENTKISQEIEALKENNDEDSIKVKYSLESLKFSLNNFQAQAPKTAEIDAHDCSKYGDQMNIEHANGEKKFEMMELDNQIENETILKSLLDLEIASKRLDIAEEIDNAFGGLKVIEVDKNFIKLLLKTHIPPLEEPSSLQRKEDKIEPCELNHELLIEVLDGTCMAKNVKIFPKDIYIDDIVDASKSFSDSSLKWLVRNVQERIILYSLRQSIVQIANNARHFFEYLDRDETIICHMVGGILGFIKFSQGWPLSNSPLKLVSLKSSNHLAKGISSNIISKVLEEANSLDKHISRCLPTFAKAVEKILEEQMH